MAVVFAMLASYVISRTLTPVIIRLLLRGEQARHMAGVHGPLDRFHDWFNRGFDRLRDCYVWLLDGILHRRIIVPAVAWPSSPGRCVLSLQVGTDFFPQVDAGLIQLHVRAPARTRIERTEQIFPSGRGQDPRQSSRKQDLELVLDNIGLPQRTYNLAFTDGIDHRRQ